MAWLRGAALALVWTLVAVGALATSFAVHLGDGLSRRALSELASGFVSNEVRGTLEVGRIRELSLGRIVIENATVYDDKGRRVANGARIVGVPEWWALLGGQVRLSYVKLEHGNVRLYFDEGDLPTLITAFQPAHTGGPPGHPPHVHISDLRVHDVHLKGDLPGLNGLDLEHLQGAATLDSVAGELELHMHWLTAHARAPFRPEADITAAQLTLVTQTHVDLDLAARNANGDSATAHLVYTLPLPHVVDLVVHTPHAMPETLTGAGVPLVDRLHGPMHGWFRLRGTPPNVLFDADLTTDGGRVRATGAISPGIMDVDAHSEGLALASFVDGAPVLTVGGHGTLHLVHEGDRTEPSFHAVVEPFAFGTIAVPPLVVDGVLEPDVVRVTHIVARDGGGTVSGAGHIHHDGSFRFHLQGAMPNVQREPTLHRLVPALRGALTGNLEVARDVNARWDVQGHAALAGAGDGSMHASRITFDGRLSGDLQRPVVNATVTATDARVGSFTIGTGSARVTGGPTHYAALASFAAAGGRTIALDARADVTADGVTVSAPTATITVGGQTWRGVAENVHVRTGRDVTIGLVRVANGSQRLEVRGTYRFRGASDLDAQLQDLDLALLRTIVGPLPIDVAGRADAHLVLHGDLSRPDIQLDGALREGRLGRIAGVDAVYTVQLTGGTLQVDGQLDLGDRGTFALSGSGDLGASRTLVASAFLAGTYLGRIEVDHFDLGALAEMTGDPRLGALHGNASGSLDFAGTRDRPLLDGQLSFAHVQLPQAPPLEFVTTEHWENDVVTFAVQVKNGDEALARATLATRISAAEVAAGTFNPTRLLREGPWTVEAVVPGLRLDTLPEPWRARVRALPIRVEANFAARNERGAVGATLGGSLAWLGNTTYGGCGGGATPRVDLSATLANGQLVATARGFLRPPEDALEAEASAPVPVSEYLTGALPDSWPVVHLSVRAPDLDLSQVPIVCASTTGHASATLTLDRAFTDTPSGRLVAHAEDLRTHGGPPATVELELNTSSRATVGDMSLDFPDGGHTDLQVMFESTWGPHDPIPVVTADARFQMQASFHQTHSAALLLFVPGIADADAVVDGQLQAQGTRSALTWSGAISLEHGQMELTGPGQRIDDFAATLRFHEQRADITRLIARDTQGTLRANGFIDFAGILPTASTLHVSLDRWPVRKEGLVLATTTGRADVSARVHSDHTDIGVRIATLTVNLPDDSLPTLQDLEPHADIIVLGEEHEALAPTTPYPVHIDLDARNPFWIRRSDFAAQIETRLSITWDAPDISVGGWVRLRRGWLEFFGRRFNLQRGSMVFDGTTDLDPDVDLVAVYTLPGQNDHNVTVAVTGSASDPQIAFSSNDPAATDQSSIIALLVTGRASLTSAAAGGGVDPTAIQTQAQSFLTGVLAGLATVSLRREFGDVLPVLAIDTNQSGGARVRAGFQADSFIRDNLPWLSGFIQSAYVEGFVSTSSDSTTAGGGTATTNNGPGGGFLIELGFPHDFVGAATYTYPQNLGLDVTWEP